MIERQARRGELARRAIRARGAHIQRDRKSTRLNSSHSQISYAVFCLKKKNQHNPTHGLPARLLAVLALDRGSLAPGRLQTPYLEHGLRHGGVCPALWSELRRRGKLRS